MNLPVEKAQNLEPVVITKLQAAQIATEAGIDTVIMNGGDPENLYKILEGHQVGTFFVAKDKEQSR